MVVDIGTPADWVKINVQKTASFYNLTYSDPYIILSLCIYRLIDYVYIYFFVRVGLYRKTALRYML